MLLSVLVSYRHGKGGFWKDRREETVHKDYYNHGNRSTKDTASGLWKTPLGAESTYANVLVIANVPLQYIRNSYPGHCSHGTHLFHDSGQVDQL